jgi:hypothetical protein
MRLIRNPAGRIGRVPPRLWDYARPFTLTHIIILHEISEKGVDLGDFFLAESQCRRSGSTRRSAVRRHQTHER